jgi:hypothetical protein
VKIAGTGYPGALISVSRRYHRTNSRAYLDR